MKSTEILSMVLRFSSIGVLIILIVQLGLICDTDVFNIWGIFKIFGQLRDLISYVLFAGLSQIFWGFTLLTGGILSNIPSFDWGYYYDLTNYAFQGFVGNWFYLPDQVSAEGAITTIGALPNANDAMAAAGVLFSNMTDDWFLLTLQIIIVFMFYHAIGASIKGDPGESIKVVVFMNLILIIPMFFVQLDVVLNLMGFTTPQKILDIVDGGILKDAIFQPVSGSFMDFIGSEIFQIAFISFMYLELTFQMSYVDKIIKPTIERESRLNRQIDLMHQNAESAIANIKSIKEEQQKKKTFNLSVEKMQEEMEERKRLSLRTFMSSQAGGSFSFIEELIEKKKLEKEEAKKMNVMKDTQRIARYLEKLFKNDPEARETLTAASAVPKSSKLVSSTIINIISRFIGIVILTWICCHPREIFRALPGSPDSIANSIELMTLEGVLSIFIPVLLLIPFISNIIKGTKTNKMKELLRLDEIQRLGITEEEYDEMKKRERALGDKPKKQKKGQDEEELGLRRDQDAIMADAQKQKRGY